MDIINQRIKSVRQWMKEQEYAAFIIPSTDPHCGEYVPEHWESRKWISGFTGSAGTAVITQSEAALWTDSRYFIQATEQLQNTPFSLMKERMPNTPSIPQWLLAVLPKHSRVAIAGETCSYEAFTELSHELSSTLTLAASADPFHTLWTDRPTLPSTPLTMQPLAYAGIPASDKLQLIRQEMAHANVSATLLSVLDEIAWTTNLRGSDIHCNPVFVSYLLIEQEKATLYIKEEKVSDSIKEELRQNGIHIKTYKAVFNDIPTLPSILIAPSSTNYAITACLSPSCRVAFRNNIVSTLKAIKNEAEIKGFHSAMLRDGVALVKFLKWLKPAVRAGKETELSISKKLENFRREQTLYCDISFDTIAGYAAHGAIVHYEATPKTDVPLKAENFLLLDSGAQYLDGTTDITRTIPLGTLTEEMKIDYTLVLKGFIQLGLAKFPEGTTGTQLDVLARSSMWRQGKNYMHGTGHGVGSHLCVHEGPHQIRMNNVPVALQAGMTVTDEPGLYREDRYGIRTENTLLITPYLQSEFGSFLQFEHLTLCPIDTTPIVRSMLIEEEIEWLNHYHQTVYNKLSPLLNSEEKAWLKIETQTI